LKLGGFLQQYVLVLNMLISGQPEKKKLISNALAEFKPVFEDIKRMVSSLVEFEDNSPNTKTLLEDNSHFEQEIQDKKEILPAKIIQELKLNLEYIRGSRSAEEKQRIKPTTETEGSPIKIDRTTQSNPPLTAEKTVETHNLSTIVPYDLETSALTTFSQIQPATPKNSMLNSICISDFNFAEAIHRKERNYKWPEENTRIRQIVTMHYFIRKKDRDPKRPDLSFLTSNFVLISNPKSALPCVIYQNYHEIERTDFSYTCAGNGKIQHMHLIRNSVDSPNKENSILLVMYKCKKKENPETEVTCVASITTDKMKLKPLFQFPDYIHPFGSHRFAVNQRVIGPTAQKEPKIDDNFRIGILVEPAKLLYAKVKPVAEWFTKLVENHCTLLLDSASIKSSHEVESIVFDTSNYEPVRLMITTHEKDSSNYDTHRFQICREQTRDPASGAEVLKLVPEYWFTTEAFNKKTRFGKDQPMSAYPVSFLNSRLSLVGIAGIFKTNTRDKLECQMNITIFDCFSSGMSIVSNLDSPKDRKNKQITFKEDSSEDSSEDPNIFLIEKTHSYSKMADGFSPELMLVHTEFEHNKKNFHLTAAVVTGTTYVYWLLTSRISGDDEGLNLNVKVVEVNLGPKELSRSQSKVDSNYLNALGQSIFIDKSSPNQLKARIAASFGEKCSSELEFDLYKFLK